MIALSLRALRKQFADVVAVDGIDLEARAGECFGLLGPNGAGKTTTIEICEGLTPPDAGEVELLGRRWEGDEVALRERLGIQLQETQLSEKLTVSETLELFRSFYDRAHTVDEVIEMVQLGEKRAARVGTLSGGQKQRLAIACGLDPQARRQLWELIESFRATGRTTLLTTHYMDEAERLCDRVAIMDHGRVIALGSPRALIAEHCAEHLVEFSLEASGGSVDAAALRALPGVSAAREAGGGWQLEVTELHRAVPELLAELERRRAVLSELRTHSSTLEDVFVKLTGRHLRDE